VIGFFPSDNIAGSDADMGIANGAFAKMRSRSSPHRLATAANGSGDRTRINRRVRKDFTRILLTLVWMGADIAAPFFGRLKSGLWSPTSSH